MFDFDLTGSGHQPRYYDQLLGAELYNSYRVDKVDYVLEISTGDADCFVSCLQAAKVAVPSQSTASAIVQQLELPYTQGGIASKDRRLRLAGSMDMAQIYGVDKTEWKEDEAYRGLYNANPSAVNYLTLNIIPELGTGTVYSFLTLKVVFHCVLMDRKPLTGPS